MVSFNGMTSVLNFIKSENQFRSYWARTHTDRQIGDLISLTFLFKEKRLRIMKV
jgi:hypothetical protein